MSWQAFFCPQDYVLEPHDARQQCDLKERPEANRFDLKAPQQWIRLQVDRPDATPIDAQLSIGPFYLAGIEVYALQANEISFIGRAGAEQRASRAQLSLGAYVFPVHLKESRSTDLLVRITAPSVAHWHVTLEPMTAAHETQERQMLIALHLGMLVALALIAVIGFALRRSSVNFRLALFNVAILLTVATGSGFAALYWPQWPTDIAAMAFVTMVVLRTAIWGWLYQGLIRPHLQSQLYQIACYASYGLAAIAIALYWLDMGGWARFLTLILVLAIPILHTIAALATRGMASSLKTILVGSLLVYHALHIFALVLVTQYSGQSDAPITITRILDLAIPLLAMATVFLRNRATDQMLQEAEQALMQKQAQLDYESRLHEEKRLLIDMLGHEIKNPLAAISMASNNLQNLVVTENPSAQRRLANIKRAANDIDEVMERCNLANRLESEALTAQITNVLLKPMWQELIQESGQAERFIFAALTPVEIQADAQLVKTVARNLLENALKYGLPQKPISIELLPADLESGIQGGFAVSNDIEPNLRPDPDKLFSRYYRQEGQGSRRGTGLGLSLCRQLVELMHGSINYELTPNAIRFTVTFK
ncbi:Signal transduction histidine kinase [Ectothiorhodosinus mongolicus]|uniref:histidine kinase n=1 Tax=Ectothiorhodosinus mongolicus TaxID=233100 RepID=A0A1R3VMC9_9GAMM|nr:ATP-binding protein [Ectothiorhodosinus mongolicus]SIT65696.1 Signal transduction histidine kinase [Ectothiorhodosinus mongolicus]